MKETDLFNKFYIYIYIYILHILLVHFKEENQNLTIVNYNYLPQWNKPFFPFHFLFNQTTSGAMFQSFMFILFLSLANHLNQWTRVWIFKPCFQLIVVNANKVPQKVVKKRSISMF